MKNTAPLRIIVPISMEQDWPEKDQILSCIRELNRNYRFTVFALAFPGAGWRSSPEYPSAAWMRGRAEFFRGIKDELAGEGIHCGWWNTLTGAARA